MLIREYAKRVLEREPATTLMPASYHADAFSCTSALSALLVQQFVTVVGVMNELGCAHPPYFVVSRLRTREPLPRISLHTCGAVSALHVNPTAGTSDT